MGIENIRSLGASNMLIYDLKGVLSEDDVDFLDYEESHKESCYYWSGWIYWFSFIKMLLETGAEVVGVDCLSDYYDVNLKKEELKY